MFKKIAILILTFSFSDKLLYTNKRFNTSKLSYKNIGEKHRCFKQESKKTKRFRTTTKTIGAAAVIAATAYIAVKLFEYFNPKVDDSKKNNEISKNSLVTREKIYLELSKKPGIKSSLIEHARYGAGKGLSLALTSIIAAPLFHAQSDLFGAFKKKFLQHWNGKNIETFAKLTKHLFWVSNEIQSFLEQDEFDAEEFVEFYSVFIELLEDYIAISQEFSDLHTDKKSKLNLSIKKIIKLIYSKTNVFSKELEFELNNNEAIFLEKDNIKNMHSNFIKLNEKIKRFIQTITSIVYENNKSF